MGVICWTLLLVGGSAVILERYWIHPLRAQLKGIQIAAYGNAQRINGLENVQTTSPLMFRSGRDATALTQIEQCVAKQVAGVKARYEAIHDGYLSCSVPLASFFDRFRLTFSEAERFAVFVTLLSSRLGSYGPSESTAPEQIAKDDVLNCTQTMIFVARTIKRFYPEAQVREIGISNQAMGEHGFVEMSNGDRSMLLDGLVGLVADISLDEATAGKRPPPFLMLEFFPETNANLRALSENFMRTLRLGGLSRADIHFDQQVAAAPLRG
ncbi:hypothetical protein QO058_12855 [Bosea vestrisii]|uniref:hypothetical protein n=1 Tax=Bosea vestrisii TaxID=151416 RepID=UPI0024E02A8A|nr:hypothetical protein [Bosea vestrisii]WID99054.1 hypothetical protein QO058_12855 [Bosea vestrisii]